MDSRGDQSPVAVVQVGVAAQQEEELLSRPQVPHTHKDTRQQKEEEVEVVAASSVPSSTHMLRNHSWVEGTLGGGLGPVAAALRQRYWHSALLRVLRARPKTARAGGF